jgi:two-component system osmolarity sensor histidine kinase EnvZ
MRIFGSLTVRIGAAFLLGLMLIQTVIAAVVMWPDGSPTMFRLVSPHEAAAIAKALETASPAQRELIVDALNGGSLIVHLQKDFSDDDVGSRPAPYLEKLFHAYSSDMQGRAFQVRALGDTALASVAHSGIGAPGAIRLLVRLRTGDVLVIERAPIMIQRLLSRFALIAGVTALVLLLVMLYCLRQMVRPAIRLAHAARLLAADIDAPNLSTRGATEISMLSAAFNDMKRTIRGLMDERTRMLAAIAHDLRTYLTRLRLRTDFIGDADQQARAVRDLDDMGLLLDDTLMFARETRRSARRTDERTDARVEIDSFVKLRRELGEPVDCKDDYSGEPLPTHCAPLALRRMLSNLTDNAVRYGHAAHLSAWRENTHVKVAVDDEGTGVPPESFARLMEPFERLEPSRGRTTGGTGLGLAIVSALAKSQGGELMLENRPNGGLRATICLPARNG